MIGVMGRRSLPLFTTLILLCTISPISAQKSDLAQLSLWQAIKRSLVAPHGKDYFENSLRDSLVPGGAGGVPYFIGTVLSSRPQSSPQELVVAISDELTPEVTLRFFDDQHEPTSLKKPLARGTKIAFEGIPTAFSREPFAVIFEVYTGQPFAVIFEVYTGRPDRGRFSRLEDLRKSPVK